MKKKENNIVDMETKKEKQSKNIKKKLKARKFWNGLMCFVIACIMLGLLSGFSIIKLVLSKTDVQLEVGDLASKDSSIIYDSEGNEISIIGNDIRINASYNQMPQALIDAFISVEDSRFYEHNGFDVPRFAKAFLENLKTLSFSQGGSTITMQVIKNTYFSVYSEAEKSIDRKIQEIYWSMKISDVVSKEKIIEMYINKVNYGESTRGVEVASQYYFGKDCTDLSLVECALLAGLVNSPNYYNPYYHLDRCTERTHDVLYLMNYHGYITDTEYENAKKVKIENLLNGESNSYINSGGNYIKNQAYVDVVLEELNDVYGIDPYYTPVRVYTGMNQTVQDACDRYGSGTSIDYYDEHINGAAAVVQNYTGLIVGVCGGRNYSGTKMFNYASDNRTSPGSTSKAVFTYPLAFEYAGISPSSTVVDEPILWDGTELQIYNDTRKYNGQITIARAVGSSLNIPAIKMYYLVAEAKGWQVQHDYLQSLGFDTSMCNNLNPQYAIGGNGWLSSPIQMAGALSAVLSKGNFTKTHTITRIEFMSGEKDPIIANYSSNRVLSEAASFLTSYILSCNVDTSLCQQDDFAAFASTTCLKRKDCVLYGKTGTNGYDYNVCEEWGYPSTAAKDLYRLFGSADYSCAVWLGYDTGRFQDKTTYIPSSYPGGGALNKVIKDIMYSTIDAFGLPENEITKPDTVKTITFLDGLWPNTEVVEGANSITGWIKEGYEQLEPFDHANTICSILDFKAEYDVTTNSLLLNYPKYPDWWLTEDTHDQKYVMDDLTEPGKVYEGKRRFGWDWVDGQIHYYYNIYDNEACRGEPILSGHSDQKDQAIDVSILPSGTYYVEGFYSYTIADVRSNQIVIEFVKY